jgi:hypothetical protein
MSNREGFVIDLVCFHLLFVILHENLLKKVSKKRRGRECVESLRRLMKMKMKSKGMIWLIGYFSRGEETSGATDDIIQEQFLCITWYQGTSEVVYIVI